MSRDRLSALDTVLLSVETPTAPLHVGSLLLLEGNPPSHEAFQAHLESVLAAETDHLLRARRLPLDVARPFWVDDEKFCIGEHVRYVHLSAPGDARQLRDLVVRVMADPLEMDRPPWEIWHVDGLEGNRWAVIVKAHHAMVDGVSGEGLVRSLLSTSASAPPSIANGNGDVPRRVPPVDGRSGSRMGVLSLPFRVGRALGSAVRSPSDTHAAADRVRRGLSAVAQPDLPPSILNGPLGVERGWGWVDGDLTAVRVAAAANGCTVNDMFLAVVSGALRTYLTGKGEFGDGIALRALVPVSRRDVSRAPVGRNRVSAFFLRLPAELPDPRARLAAIAARTAQQKERDVPGATDSVLRLADHLPAMLLGRAAREYGRHGQHRVNVVASNVAGPSRTMYLGDSRLLEMVPFIPVALEVRSTFALLTYAGRFTISVTLDVETCPDVDSLIAAMSDSLGELVGLEPLSVPRPEE